MERRDYLVEQSAYFVEWFDHRMEQPDLEQSDLGTKWPDTKIIHSVQASQFNADVPENDSNELGIYSLYSFHTNKPNYSKYTVELGINGKESKMELDTAADYSIMSKSEYLERFADRPLTPSKVTLRIYTGEVLDGQYKIRTAIMDYGLWTGNKTQTEV